MTRSTCHFAALLALLVSLAAADRVQADEAASDPLVAAVKRLGDEKFLVREKANEKLVAARAKAIGPLETVLGTSESEAEQQSRALRILEGFATDENDELRTQALAAVYRLSSAKREKLAVRATRSLTMIRETRRKIAMAFLEQRGARFKLELESGAILGGERERHLEIGDEWRGQEEDLKVFADLDDLQYLRLVGEKVEDSWFAHVATAPQLKSIIVRHAKISSAGLAHLKTMEPLTSISILYTPIDDEAAKQLLDFRRLSLARLYGTEISDAVATQLASDLPAVKIDVRKGGFLGVGVQNHPLGCLVWRVQPNSAAEKAGITERGDVILSLGGEKVSDFESLTTVVAKYSAGEEIAVDMYRGAKREVLKVKLGEWEQ